MTTSPNHYQRAYVNPVNPVNWRSPLTKSLLANWTVPRNPGWSGGLSLRNLASTKYTGTLTNGPTWSTVAPDGTKSLLFDGTNDYVDVPTITTGTVNQTV